MSLTLATVAGVAYAMLWIQEGYLLMVPVAIGGLGLATLLDHLGAELP